MLKELIVNIGMSWMLALEKLANLGRKWEGLGAWKSEGQGRNIGLRIKSICQGRNLILSYAKVGRFGLPVLSSTQPISFGTRPANKA